MHRGKAFLVALAMLLTGSATCKYNPTVDPNNLLCQDDNGCPLGYFCMVDAGSQPGFCCKQDAGACFASTDAISIMGDSMPMEASSDGFAHVDSSAAQNLNGASDAFPIDD